MLRILLPFWAALLLSGCQTAPSPEHETPSEAGESLRFWAMARMFPDGHFHTEKYVEAMALMRAEAGLHSQDRNADWEAIGPKNIGGRTLCLAVHPLDSNMLYAGSASGGLWKSTTAGRGKQAWTRIETGFPVLGVSAIAIDPKQPNTLYIGTGEVYNLEFSMPNVAFRTTRGTYGIGILKSTDGGQTWMKSLDWAYGDLKGVQDIKINPLRPATIYAATTEGLLRSYDAGASWKVVHNRKMAVDIEINPADTAKIFVSHGSLDDDVVSGIFRSINGGQSFSLLNNGLPVAYSGKALIGLCATQPDIMYVSVGNAFSQEGLYKSANGGDVWTKVNSTDVCSYQGWYSHDVAVHPTAPNTFIWTGIDLWKSLNGGTTLAKKTLWNSWYFGYVPVGGPEGPPNYVHADIHRVYWMTGNPKAVYCVTDGGIFASSDGGETWEGRNGGYQTQQFYANLGNSATNPLLCIGGMQDNSTAIYSGNDAWTRVIGGDGESAAISQVDDQTMFGSYQYLGLLKSTDGGQNFYSVVSSEMNEESPCFNGPFEASPSDPLVMYAGAQSLFKSEDMGETWTNATNGFLADGDPILTIAVHPYAPQEVFCSTVPYLTNFARVFKVNAATGVMKQINGLPNRFCMDIAYDPVEPSNLFAVFAGFNTSHVWRSTDGGTSWTAVDNGLPDVPANSILIDPLSPNYVYIGNDLGVWFSRDRGDSWELFSDGAPYAMPAMHLSMSASRKLRVATHGLGVWQKRAVELVGTGEPSVRTELNLTLSPNPVVGQLQVQSDLPEGGMIHVRILDTHGRVMHEYSGYQPPGPFSKIVDCMQWPAGPYFAVLEMATVEGNVKRTASRKFIRK